MVLSQRAAVLLALCSATVVLQRYLQERRAPRLPPGPRPLPLIGNALDVPKVGGWKTFVEWGKQYGSDLLYVKALGTSILVLNSYEAAEDLLDKRSGIYSSRPHLVVLHEFSGLGFGFAFLPYGERWRSGRRLFTRHLSATRPEIHQPREIKYVEQFLLKLLETPRNYMKHIRYVVGSHALSSVYGLEVLSVNDPYLDGAEALLKAASPLSVPGGFLVDSFPPLKHLPGWFPGANFHKITADIRAAVPLLVDVTFAASEEIKRSGKYDPCLATNGLEEIDSSGESSRDDVNLLKEVCAQAFLAGSDTTVSAISSFFLAMVLYPDVQKRAQAELDEVLHGRLPVHSDLDNLPYFEALVLEVFRWNPVLPLGVPHVLVGGDDNYRDYHIPENTLVIPNQWAMLRDETIYPQPSVFRPERFLDAAGNLNKEIRSPLDIAFGFGRRLCPGRHIAYSLLTFTMASVLSSFDLLKQLDEEGKEIPVAGDYHLGPICQPVDFPCRISPRSPETVHLLQELQAR